MSGDTLVVIIPLLALFLLLVGIGSIFAWWRMSRKSKPTNQSNAINESSSSLQALFDEPPQAQPAVTGQTPAPPAAYQPVSRPVSDGNTVEVMRILRDLADGSILVEINGRQYRSLSEIGDPQIGRQFIGNALAVAEFARLEKTAGKVSDSSEQAQSARKSMLPDQSSDEAVPLPWIQDDSESPKDSSSTLLGSLLPNDSAPPQYQPSAAYPQPPVPQPPVPMPPVPPSATASSNDSSDDQENVSAPKSIADQIEELLQYRLQQSPHYARRSIHIRPALDGGVRVEVDGRFFDGVGDVADAGVKEFILSVVQEWEARQ